MKKLVSAGLALATMLQLSPVMAQSLDLESVRTEMLLRKLLAEKQPAAKPRSLVSSISAEVRVKGTIRKASSFDLPLFCWVDIGSYGQNGSSYHFETKTGAVKFNGDNGVCDITLPFKWENVDDEGTIDVEVYLYNWSTTGGAAQEAAVKARAPVLRYSEIDLGDDIPMPKQGTTTKLSFSARL